MQFHVAGVFPMQCIGRISRGNHGSDAFSRAREACQTAKVHGQKPCVGRAIFGVGKAQPEEEPDHQHSTGQSHFVSIPLWLRMSIANWPLRALVGDAPVKSETLSIQQLFQDRRQYRVPFYQRAYVWNREDQWERLWSDIQDKAEARLLESKPIPHFLGAAVLEPQPRHGLLGVEALHIIDGQQRLTTLQYILAALAITLRGREETALLSLVDGCLRNPNPETMKKPEMEKFKLWPTFRDQQDFRKAMDAQSLDELRQRFPSSFTQGGQLRKIGMDHPPGPGSHLVFQRPVGRLAQG